MENSLQNQIIELINDNNQGRWAWLKIFSEEGLLIAQWGKPANYSEETILETALVLRETALKIQEENSVDEIIISGQRQSRLIFRYMEIWDEPVIIAAGIFGKKGYKRALNRVINQIRTL